MTEEAREQQAWTQERHDKARQSLSPVIGGVKYTDVRPSDKLRFITCARRDFPGALSEIERLKEWLETAAEVFEECQGGGLILSSKDLRGDESLQMLRLELSLLGEVTKDRD